MDYKQRAYPLFSACGLNCGLCPRYQMDGASKCPGCSGKDFLTKHPKCGVLSCTQRKGFSYCFECDEFPCQKYEGADASDSFITHRHQMVDMDKARRLGMPAYQQELDEKIELLENLLAHFDDGRRKSLFCLAVNLLDLSDVKSVMEQIQLQTSPEQSLKERAAVAVRRFHDMAEQRGISLQLRKKTKT